MKETEALSIERAIPALAGGSWRGVARRALEAVLGLRETRELFGRAAARGEVFAEMLRELEIAVDAQGVAEAVPDRGAAVIFANHPFGGADALAVGAVCRALRPDVKVLANEAVAALPGMGDVLLPLSILGAAGAAGTNAVSLRKALAHLKRGGLLVAFPAGAVASWRPDRGGVAEADWSPHPLELAKRARAQVAVLHVHGRNPPWFFLLGALHPLVRTALLPRVLLSQRGMTAVLEPRLRAAAGRLQIEEIQALAETPAPPECESLLTLP